MSGYGIGGLFSGFVDGYKTGVNINSQRDADARANAEAERAKEKFNWEKADREKAEAAANDVVNYVADYMTGRQTGAQNAGGIRSVQPAVDDNGLPMPAVPQLAPGAPGTVRALTPEEFAGGYGQRMLNLAAATKDTNLMRQMADSVRSGAVRENAFAAAQALTGFRALKEGAPIESVLPALQAGLSASVPGAKIAAAAFDPKTGHVMGEMVMPDGSRAPLLLNEGLVMNGVIRGLEPGQMLDQIHRLSEEQRATRRDVREEAKEKREADKWGITRPGFVAQAGYEASFYGAKDGQTDAENERKKTIASIGQINADAEYKRAHAVQARALAKRADSEGDELKKARVEELRAKGIDRALGGAPDPNKAMPAEVDLYTQRRAIASAIFDFPENKDIKPEQAGAVARKYIIDPKRLNSGREKDVLDVSNLAIDPEATKEQGAPVFVTRVGTREVSFSMPPNYAKAYAEAILRSRKAAQKK